MNGTIASEKVYLALHEERYPHAVFRTRDAARAWIAEQREPIYTFTIEELDLPSN